MNADQTVVILRQLAAAFPREVTRDMIDLWHNVFDDAADDDVQKAVAEWIKTAEHFPTPAQIRGIMRDHLRRRQMAGGPALPAAPLDPEPDDTGVRRDRNRIVPVAEGIDIAYEAYCRECARQGIQPRTRSSFANRIPVEQRREARLRKKWKRDLGHAAEDPNEAYATETIEQAVDAVADEAGEWADADVEPDPEGTPASLGSRWPNAGDPSGGDAS